LTGIHLAGATGDVARLTGGTGWSALARATVDQLPAIVEDRSTAAGARLRRRLRFAASLLLFLVLAFPFQIRSVAVMPLPVPRAPSRAIRQPHNPAERQKREEPQDDPA
jgi:hypothetical protein